MMRLPLRLRAPKLILLASLAALLSLTVVGTALAAQATATGQLPPDQRLCTSEIYVNPYAYPYENRVELTGSAGGSGARFIVNFRPNPYVERQEIFRSSDYETGATQPIVTVDAASFGAGYYRACARNVVNPSGIFVDFTIRSFRF